MTRNDPMVHAGALKHAIRLLRWLAENEGDDPEVIEVVKQSRECARALVRDLRRWERKKART